MITFKHSGTFKKTEKFLSRAEKVEYTKILEKYGRIGVNALEFATPIESGETARAWDYIIRISNNKSSVTWINTNIVDGVPIAVLLQYGHGTRNGGYVQGRDYINPAIKPMFDRIADDAWQEVIKL